MLLGGDSIPNGHCSSGVLAIWNFDVQGVPNHYQHQSNYQLNVPSHNVRGQVCFIN